MPKRKTALEYAVDYYQLKKEHNKVRTILNKTDDNSKKYHSLLDKANKLYDRLGRIIEKTELRHPDYGGLGQITVISIDEGKAYFNIHIYDDMFSYNQILKFMSIIMKEVDFITEKDSKGEFYFPMDRLKERK